MRSRNWLIAGAVLLGLACSSADAEDSSQTGGSSGSPAGGSAGSANGGSAGHATGGSGGHAVGGSAGASGGAAGSSANTGGSETGGAAGTAAGGSAGTGGSAGGPNPGSTIADHTVVKALWEGRIPESALANAKQNLKIGYGHTSHGNQLTLGMQRLVAFANAGNLGGVNYSQDLLAVSQDGAPGSLHLFNGSDYVDDNPTDWLSGDAGWANAHFAEETREFLADPSHSAFNVIIWSWCGELATADEAGVITNYLNPLAALEADYPGVMFVYMTGHLDSTGLNAANVNARNEQIRTFCRDNHKWLFDFADIESYDPDGNYYLDKLSTDGCNYDADGDGVVTVDSSDPAVASGGDRNWAKEWQDSHVLGTDWFESAADMVHTQHVNGDMKAFASWWLWARMAGWDGTLSN